MVGVWMDIWVVGGWTDDNNPMQGFHDNGTPRRTLPGKAATITGPLPDTLDTLMYQRKR